MEISTTLPSSDQPPPSLLRKAKRWITIVIGMSVLGFGLAAILLPFIPAFIIVPLGLAILATELIWARRLLNKVKEKMPFQNKEKDNNDEKK